GASTTRPARGTHSTHSRSTGSCAASSWPAGGLLAVTRGATAVSTTPATRRSSGEPRDAGPHRLDHGPDPEAAAPSSRVAAHVARAPVGLGDHRPDRARA